jgi:tRNA(fMet)-specific endonuclease VapC
VIVLDTDHLNHLQIRRGTEFENLLRRMGASVDSHFTTTIISFEEHTRGWLASIQRSRAASQQVKPYSRLLKMLEFYHSWQVLGFDDAAAIRFEELRARKIRIGSMDLKMASIVLQNDAILLTANARDFEQVPGLRIENWLH